MYVLDGKRLGFNYRNNILGNVLPTNVPKIKIVLPTNDKNE